MIVRLHAVYGLFFIDQAEQKNVMSPLVQLHLSIVILQVICYRFRIALIKIKFSIAPWEISK